MEGRLLNASSSVCGGASVLGSYQLCHNICIGIIALLTTLGITVTGMPLLFLTKIALPLWIAALALLAISAALVFRFSMNLPKKMLLANTGLIIAGIPFANVQRFTPVFWTIGGVLVATSIIWAIAERKRK